MEHQDSDWPLQPVTDWLLLEGRFLDLEQLVSELGNRLVKAGAPVWRFYIGYQMLHPQLKGTSSIWTRANDGVHSYRVTSDVLESDRYVGSPIQALFASPAVLRRRLDDDAAAEHAVYASLKTEGFTDYLGVPMRFSDDKRSFMIVVTKASQGYSADDLEKFQRFANFVVPVVEIYARRRLAKSLLDTYVGPRTGQKVLQGMIERGDAEVIEAALWFSDLRDFTHYTETLPADELLSMLNAYFEFVAAAVTARGGEILRFIGDAMLIIFPVLSGQDARQACEAAFDSARDAFDSLAALNHRRRRAGRPEISFGVGLNVGEVIHGNVGAPDRLDFTVMGPAVNRVARLEALTKELEEPILMSAVFAEALPAPSRFLGEHVMKGVAQRQAVYAPA